MSSLDPLPAATNILSSIIAAFTGGIPAGGSHGSTQLSGSGILDPSVGGFLTHQNGQTAGGKPRAYLNWMILDEEQFKLVEGNYGVEQIPEITPIWQVCRVYKFRRPGAGMRRGFAAWLPVPE